MDNQKKIIIGLSIGLFITLITIFILLGGGKKLIFSDNTDQLHKQNKILEDSIKAKETLIKDLNEKNSLLNNRIDSAYVIIAKEEKENKRIKDERDKERNAVDNFTISDINKFFSEYFRQH